MAKKNLRTKEAQEVKEPDYGWITKELMDNPGVMKALAKQGLRIVKLTDVTVTRETLIKVLASSGKIAGNEVPAFVEQILKAAVIG